MGIDPLYELFTGLQSSTLSQWQRFGQSDSSKKSKPQLQILNWSEPLLDILPKPHVSKDEKPGIYISSKSLYDNRGCVLAGLWGQSPHITDVPPFYASTPGPIWYVLQ